MNSVIASLQTAQATPIPDSSIGRTLLDLGKITTEDAENILRAQKSTGTRFGEAAIALGIVSKADISQALALQFSYPYLLPGEGNLSPLMVAAYEPFSHQVEELRAIRSQLMLRWFSMGKSSLTIVGTGKQEGVSIFAANLAIVFSQLGENTILVDANLRSPVQHSLFNMHGKQGLSDILAGRADVNAVQKVSSLANLSLLSAGTIPPNPQELLNRPSFKATDLNLRNTHDVVIYDTPSLNASADALAVSTASGALLIVRKNRSVQREITAAVAKLQRTGCEVVGTILIG